MRIDAHHHFWQPARGDYGWLRPDVAALAALYRDFLPHDLQPLLRADGVQQTVLVQAAESTAETDYLLGLAADHDFVGAVVGWVDMADESSVPMLERWARQPKFKGVRPMLQDLADADWIATAPHPRVVQALIDLDLRFDALVKPWHLEALLAFVRRYPQLPVVIDHGAKPQLALGWQAPWVGAWRAGMAALAALPSVCCKCSGLLTEADPARIATPEGAAAELRPVWEALAAWFGPRRLMWGSDWPVLNLAGRYEAWVRLCSAWTAGWPEADRDAFWFGNAQRFYGLAPA